MTAGARPRIGIVAHPELIRDPDEHDEMLHYVVAAPYVKAVRKAGAVPIVLAAVDASDIEPLLDSVDAAVITGGCDIDPSTYGASPHPKLGVLNPARDEIDIEFARALVARDQPTLAVCRGIQVLDVALGGTLAQHVDEHMRLDAYNADVHPVKIESGSTLATVMGGTEVGVNTLHHQVIDTLGPRVHAVAWNPDGHVEGIEVRGAPHILGVQWHPELLRHRPEHLALFEWLVASR
ncbi:MAG TPA: gamma-glutamyl-gamma-aminobutyrate hydrolase family protein [Acidimicrobiia bacterium]|jgi:putative glutamine amidotransferase